jgi:radical SAM superfamily enzyme YgiQ (UPF0313 family)
VLPGPGEVQALQWANEVSGEARPLSEPIEEVLPAHDLRRRQGYVAVQTAQGCPFDCPYCAADRLAPRGFAPRSPGRVVDEITWCVERLGARDVAFYDDALLYDAERHIHPILDGLLARSRQARGPWARFHTPNGLHARYVDRGLARKMRRAGFVTLRLGLETADPEEQRRDGAKVDRDAFARAVEALWAAGFTAREVAAYVLIGRPGQDVEAARATAAYAQGLGVPVHTAQFSPIPGTREWEAAVEGGSIPADADPLLHNNSAYPCANAGAWEALKVQIRAQNRALLR